MSSLKKIERSIRKKICGTLKINSKFYKKKITAAGYFDKLEVKQAIEQKSVELVEVSIIIPVYNQLEYTRKCIQSIYKNTYEDINFEVIVVDDCSSENLEMVKSEFPKITYLKNEKNLGFLRSVNKGVKAASGHYIHLLNNDTIVTRNWLKSLLDIFSSYPNAGVVGSKLIYPNGVLQEAGGHLDTDLMPSNYGKGKNIFDFQYNFVRECGYVSGASMLVKKKLWDEIGGLDERYVPAYYEDTDFCLSVQQAGLQVLYQPLSVVVHYESISYGREKNSKKSSQMNINREKFLAKWNNCDFLLKKNGQINRKSILIIDRIIPDIYDCGSRLLLNLFQAYKKLNYSIKYLPMKVSKSSDKRIAELGQHGIEILATHDYKGNSANFDEYYKKKLAKWLLKHSNDIHQILCCRPSSIKYLEMISKIIGKKLSYLYHPADLHFLRSKREHQVGNRKRSRPLSDVIKKKREIGAIRDASKVLHVSTFENELMKEEYNINNGTVIPCLTFDNPSDDNDLCFSSNDLMYVGSSHRPSVDGICWFIECIFPAIQLDYPDCKLHVIGNVGDKLIHSKNLVIHGKIDDDDLINFYRKCIAIIPLRYGAGVKGKTLEAMAYGKAFVSTQIGLEGILGISNSITTFNTPSSFAGEIASLLHDDSIFEKRRKLCRSIISRYYTQDHLINILARLDAGNV